MSDTESHIVPYLGGIYQEALRDRYGVLALLRRPAVVLGTTITKADTPTTQAWSLITPRIPMKITSMAPTP